MFMQQPRVLPHVKQAVRMLYSAVLRDTTLDPERRAPLTSFRLEKVAIPAQPDTIERRTSA